MSPTHRPCVSVIIFRITKEGRKEVLLVHKPRKHDAWQVPQGGIEGAESPEEAARREIHEETGIDLPELLTVSSFHYQYDYPEGFKRSQKPKFSGQHLTFLTATVPPETSVQVDNRELDVFQWVHPSDLGKYLKRKEYLGVVRKVVREYWNTGITE